MFLLTLLLTANAVFVQRRFPPPPMYLPPSRLNAFHHGHTHPYQVRNQPLGNPIPGWQYMAPMYNGGYTGPGNQPFQGKGASKFYDDMNLDDYFNQDYDTYTANWNQAHRPPPQHPPPQHHQQQAEEQESEASETESERPQYPRSHNNYGPTPGMGPRRPGPGSLGPVDQVFPKDLAADQLFLTKIQENSYCRSPIIRLGQAQDTFMCSQLVQNEENCSNIFYTSPTTRQCTCAHITASCQYQLSRKQNDVYLAVTPTMMADGQQELLSLARFLPEQKQHPDSKSFHDWPEY